MGKDPASRLRQELEDTGRALAAARSGFDRAADRDLLEYYLYEISALGAKHTYLLRRMKALEGEDPEKPQQKSFGGMHKDPGTALGKGWIF